MTRAAIVVAMISVLLLTPAAADFVSREQSDGASVKTPRSALRERALEAHGVRMILASAPGDVQPSAGFEDEYSPVASFDDDAPVDQGKNLTTVTEDEPKTKNTTSSGTSLVVLSGNENATETSGEINATSASPASLEESGDGNTTALVVSYVDPVRRVTAKTAVARANGTLAEAPAPTELNGEVDGDGDAPGPAPELSSDEETLAEAPEGARTNTTANISASAPAPSNATEGIIVSTEAPESGLKTASATNASDDDSDGASDGAAEGDDTVSDDDDAEFVLEKKQKKDTNTTKETAGAVEEEEDAPTPAPAPALEEKDAAAALVTAGLRSPGPGKVDLQASEKSAPTPPVAGMILPYKEDVESVENDVKRAEREEENKEDASPSWWEAAAGKPSVASGALQLEVAVHPEGGESQFERALPIGLGGCVLLVTGLVVYSRAKGTRRKARRSAGGARNASKKTAWNEDWSSNDDSSWSDSGERRKPRESPVSAEKWAAEEPAWSDEDERNAGDGSKDGWR
jgi:hypothetical protein